MSENRLPALSRFIDEMRALYAEPMDPKDRFDKARPLLQTLLSDAELRERSKSWPSGSDHANRDYTNLLFYEDPDYGFAVNALVKDPGEQTPIHDHAHTWTLYGVLEGGEKRRASPSGCESGIGDVTVHVRLPRGISPRSLRSRLTSHLPAPSSAVPAFVRRSRRSLGMPPANCGAGEIRGLRRGRPTARIPRSAFSAPRRGRRSR